ncbi:uncharacterized protein LOC141652804 [Silene latifolia]|uniref:uncharacterized protein LOC141652804 n=1 Tax=Silene latifolia TaxID=37657 RepID=UPI003D7832FC
MSPELANDMKWHVMERTKDGILRHPADAEAWSSFDNKYPEFALEPRNVRLGLASDGFNPFGRMDSTHSTWPVILIPYNLPPWLCMKKENFILSMIIPGPKSPGNNIDVYLQPLIEELAELWENGIPTFDSSAKEETFLVKKRPRTVTVQNIGDDVTPVQTPRSAPDFLQVTENEAFLPHVDSNGEDFFVYTTLEGVNGEDQSESVTTKRRGPTMMTHIWNLPKNQRVTVDWNSCWQPVGGEQSQLAHFIGTMAWNPNLCSLSYPPDWRLVPEDQKDELLRIVKSKFIIPNSQAAKYVLQSMGRKWSNFKDELKNDFYEPNRGNVSNVLNAKPNDIPRDQWISLVTYWSSTKGKERSDKNRRSRECQVMVHTVGSKSFVCVIEEQTVDGVPPSRAHVFLETHKDRKTVPAPMDEKSKQAVEMINEKLNDMPNNKEVTNGAVAWDGDIYSQVMINKIIGPERKGRVRGFGKGPSALPSTTCNANKEGFDDDHILCNEKIKLLESEVKKVNDICVKIQEDSLEVQRKMQEELTMLKVALFGRDILTPSP